MGNLKKPKESSITIKNDHKPVNFKRGNSPNEPQERTLRPSNEALSGHPSPQNRLHRTVRSFSFVIGFVRTASKTDISNELPEPISAVTATTRHPPNDGSARN